MTILARKNRPTQRDLPARGETQGPEMHHHCPVSRTELDGTTIDMHRQTTPMPFKKCFKVRTRTWWQARSRVNRMIPREWKWRSNVELQSVLFKDADTSKKVWDSAKNEPIARKNTKNQVKRWQKRVRRLSGNYCWETCNTHLIRRTRELRIGFERSEGNTSWMGHNSPWNCRAF